MENDLKNIVRHMKNEEITESEPLRQNDIKNRSRTVFLYKLEEL